MTGHSSNDKAYEKVTGPYWQGHILEYSGLFFAAQLSWGNASFLPLKISQQVREVDKKGVKTVQQSHCCHTMISTAWMVVNCVREMKKNFNMCNFLCIKYA